jgi:hypothetical protein
MPWNEVIQEAARLVTLMILTDNPNAPAQKNYSKKRKQVEKKSIINKEVKYS